MGQPTEALPQGQQRHLISVIPSSSPKNKLVDTKYRKYGSNVTAYATIHGQQRITTMPINYEVGAREWLFEHGDASGAFNQLKWKEMVLAIGGNPYCDNAPYETPKDVRAALAADKKRHVSMPNWTYFNFDAIVCVLGGMLAALTMNPSLTTKDFRGSEPQNLQGLNSTDDAYALGEGGVVYAHSQFFSTRSRHVFWVLSSAVQIAGAKLVTDHLDCDVNGKVFTHEVNGLALARGVLECLSTLAWYYDQAGRGDCFALALTRGLHRILTVVGHCDEGGWVRDMLRNNQYAPPYGGMPAGLPLVNGVPLFSGNEPASLVSMVDGMLLATAAVIAHCDPMVDSGDAMHPTVIQAEPGFWNPQRRGAGAARAQAELEKHMAAKIYEMCPLFVSQYASALARLFGLTAHTDYLPAADYLTSAISRMVASGSRHCGYPVMAPFFIIEPTTIIPKNFLGSQAELYGCGSLVSPGEEAVLPFLRDARQVGVDDHLVTDWEFTMLSARTSGFVLMLAFSELDGLAGFKLKCFDSNCIALAKLSPEEMRERKLRDGFVDVGALLWTRGQSKIPHPAELVNSRVRVGMSLVHYTEGRWTRPDLVPMIPTPRDIASTKVTLRCTRLRFWEIGDRNVEPPGVKRLRTKATEALEEWRRNCNRVFPRLGRNMDVSENNPAMPVDLLARERDSGVEEVLEPVQQLALSSKVTTTASQGQIPSAVFHHGVTTAPLVRAPTSGGTIVSAPVQTPLPTPAGVGDSTESAADSVNPPTGPGAVGGAAPAQ